MAAPRKGAGVVVVITVVAALAMTSSCVEGGAVTQPPADAAVLVPPADAADVTPPIDGATSPECGTQTWSPSSCGATTWGGGQHCANQRCECLSGPYGKNQTYVCDILSSQGCVDSACRCSVYRLLVYYAEHDAFPEWIFA